MANTSILEKEMTYHAGIGNSPGGIKSPEAKTRAKRMICSWENSNSATGCPKMAIYSVKLHLSQIIGHPEGIFLDLLQGAC